MSVRQTTLLLLAALAVTFCPGCWSRSAPSPAATSGTDGDPKAKTEGLTPLSEKTKDGPGEEKSAPKDEKSSATDSSKQTKAGSTGQDPQPAGAEAGPPVDLKSLLPELVAGFRSPYSVEVFQAAEKLRQLPPEARRNALAELSAHESANVRENAWRAFATWATREDVPTLIAALQSPHEDVHTAALELMAQFPNVETIGVLTKLLPDGNFRERAEALLIRVGPAAEGAILAYIDHTDAALRSASWRVLGEIGTRKSLLALERLATQQQFQNDAELQGSLAKIRERLRR